MVFEFVGKVVSNRMQKSVLVAIDRLVRQKKYDTVIKRTSKLMAHDDKDQCNIGDTVRIRSCRPLSKRKSYIVTDVLHRARVFDATASARRTTPQHQQTSSYSTFASSALASS